MVVLLVFYEEVVATGIGLTTNSKLVEEVVVKQLLKVPITTITYVLASVLLVLENVNFCNVESNVINEGKALPSLKVAVYVKSYVLWQLSV